MEAFKATSLTPVLVFSEKTEANKVSSFSPLKQPKIAKSKTTPPIVSKVLLRNINRGLAVLSSVFSSGFARALTYEEALELSKGTSTSDGSAGFDVSGLVDGVVQFGTENPAVIIGGATLLSLPLVLSRVLKKPKPWGIESAKNAYAKLSEDSNAQLLDIRNSKEVREVGSPNVGGLGKKVVLMVYKAEDKTGFLKKLSLKFKERENITLFILDKFDGNSELVAELVALNGFKAALAIKDGAEGPKGWMNSGLPWTAPKKLPALDFGNLADVFSGALEEGPDALSVTLAAAAATGLSLLAFTEVETLLQLLGSAAVIQFLSKKLLFAEDRKQTLQLANEFLNTKVAPKELVDDVKQIGKALLPVSLDKKALPAPVEASSDAAVPETSVQNAEAVPELDTSSVTEAKPELTPQVNAVPKSEVNEEALPKKPRPLSPYPNYPDFRPPASPTPSPP